MVLIPRVCASISKESLFRVRKEEKQRPEHFQLQLSGWPEFASD